MRKFKFRKITALVLVFAMMIGMSGSVFAIERNAEGIFGDYDKYSQEEARRINQIINSDDSTQYLNVVTENVPIIKDHVSPYITCQHCGSMVGSYCLKEAILDDEGYHNDFWGNQTDCYAYYFVSHGVNYCGRCDIILSTHGPHACMESHRTCSKGEYDYCPMDVS